MSRPLISAADAIRCSVGGLLMGLANLVPGVSGGTMLLVTGAYRTFVNGVSELSSMKFRLASITGLAMIGVPAALAILILAGTLRDLVLDHRWVMYSIFIGLTLGGVPVIWTMLRPFTRTSLIAFCAGIAIMAMCAVFQPGAEETSSSFLTLLLAGLLGAIAMVLPGVSGGYILLVLGQYVTILSGIDLVKTGLKSGAADTLMAGLAICIPVGIGVVTGIVVVSNAIKILLQKYERPMLGFLLGLVVGAVLGLWPFQQTVAPQIGDVIRGQKIDTLEQAAAVDRKHFPQKPFTPSAGQAGAALALILAGFGATMLLAWAEAALEKRSEKKELTGRS